MSTYTTPAGANTLSMSPMDKVCVNCGGRYGEHFGPTKGNLFCALEYHRYYEQNISEKINSKHTFIHNGEYEFKHSLLKGIKKDINPNALFKIMG